MSVTTPAALWGLLLLPLIIVCYLWRARQQRQVVSSIWLWEASAARFSHRPTRRLPLREPLLLLQLLAALALTVLLAGPRLDRPARLHQIVVLDASVAMTATDVRPDRFEAARERVLRLIENLGQDDSLSLVLAGPRARLLGELPGPLDLAGIVRATQPSSGPIDLAGAAALARGLAGASGQGMPRVIFLAAAETPTLPIGGLPVRTERMGSALDDQRIDLLSARCPGGTGPCQAFARLRNSASLVRAESLIAWADGQELGRQAVTLPARGSLELTFAVARGTRLLRVSLARHDSLAADDSAWALVPTASPLAALLVSDTPAPLARALRGVPGLQVRIVSSASYADSDAAGADLVVLDGVDPSNVPSNSLLMIDPPDTTEVVNVRRTGVFLPVEQVDASDPLLAGLDLYGLTVTGDQVDPPAWARVAAGGSKGPLILYGVQNGQRSAVLTFDIDHNSFTQDVAFPLLISRLVHWLAPLPAPDVPIGAAVSLPPSVQAIRDPAGVVYDGPVVDASVPGVYRVAAGLGALAVGVPLFSASAAVPDAISSSAITIPAGIVHAGAGSVAHGIWPLALLVALLALGGEWWFYARRT